MSHSTLAVTDKDNEHPSQLQHTANPMTRALTVEEIDTDLYKSIELWHPAGSRGVFGGQLIAHALRAAWNTVPEGFHAHSLHNYFLLPGNAHIPVIYQVKRVRDGRSFKTRVVTATQNGRMVVLCICSFTRPDESISLHHQADMPSNLPQPEDLVDNSVRAKKLVENSAVPEAYRTRYKNFMDVNTPIEYRDINSDSPEEFMSGYRKPRDREGQWFKARETLPDNDPALHTCAIVYASDSGILMSAVRANGMAGRKGISMMVSLDHSIWFHAPARADEWLYHEFNSPRSNDERGTAFGRIFNRQGVLVATCSQEGIIRLSKTEQEKRKARMSTDQAKM